MKKKNRGILRIEAPKEGINGINRGIRKVRTLWHVMHKSVLAPLSEHSEHPVTH